jgi:hypothetical protein
MTCPGFGSERNFFAHLNVNIVNELEKRKPVNRELERSIRFCFSHRQEDQLSLPASRWKGTAPEYEKAGEFGMHRVFLDWLNYVIEYEYREGSEKMFSLGITIRMKDEAGNETHFATERTQRVQSQSCLMRVPSTWEFLLNNVNSFLLVRKSPTTMQHQWV